jgi:hypothetical protein
MLCATTDVTFNCGAAIPDANNETFVAFAVANGNAPAAVVAAPSPAKIIKSGAAGNPCANDADPFDANDAIVRTSIYDPNNAIL